MRERARHEVGEPACHAVEEGVFGSVVRKGYDQVPYQTGHDGAEGRGENHSDRKALGERHVEQKRCDAESLRENPNAGGHHGAWSQCGADDDADGDGGGHGHISNSWQRCSAFDGSEGRPFDDAHGQRKCDEADRHGKKKPWGVCFGAFEAEIAGIGGFGKVRKRIAFMYVESQGGLQNRKRSGGKACVGGWYEDECMHDRLRNAERTEHHEDGGDRRGGLHVAQPCEDGYPAGKGGYGQKAGRRHRRTGPVDGNESKRHDGGALRDDGDEEGRIDGFFGKRAASSMQHPHGNECGGGGDAGSQSAAQRPGSVRQAAESRHHHCGVGEGEACDDGNERDVGFQRTKPQKRSVHGTPPSNMVAFSGMTVYRLMSCFCWMDGRIKGVLCPYFSKTPVRKHTILGGKAEFFP